MKSYRELKTSNVSQQERYRPDKIMTMWVFRSNDREPKSNHTPGHKQSMCEVRNFNVSP